MLYIVSQNGLKISDFHKVSVLHPKHDLEDDGVYKMYVNSDEFARYKDWSTVDRVMEDIKKFIHMKDNFCYELPKEGDAT